MENINIQFGVVLEASASGLTQAQSGINSQQYDIVDACFPNN